MKTLLRLFSVCLVLLSAVPPGDAQVLGGGGAAIQTSSGSITAASQSIVLSTNGMANGAFQVAGTYAGTIQFEATVDGTNWISLTATSVPTGAAATSTTATGVWTHTGAFKQVRVRSSAWTSGTATVAMIATQAGGGAAGGGGGGGSVTQGTSPWADNTTQFGGTDVSTGIGPGGAGIPRVTVSNDSTIGQANPPWTTVPDGATWGLVGDAAKTAVTPADTTTGSTTLGVLNDRIEVSLAGQVGASFTLAASNTFSVSTNVVTPQCSFENTGSNYFNAQASSPTTTGTDAPTYTLTAGQALTPYTVLCPPGARRAQMKLTTYTGTGSSTWAAAATLGGVPSSFSTLCINACGTTAAPAVSSANTAKTITLSGVSGQRICVTKVVVYPTGATGSSTLTIKDGSTVGVDYGTVTLGALSIPWEDSGTPIMCGSTGNDVVITVGAGGSSVVTNTSVVADRG